MVALNLPSFDYKIKESEGKHYIFDILRKKYVVLTPEEWVRQHFVNLLITHYKYPRALIKLETGLLYNQLKKRSDIVVYSREGQPFLIVECKSADVKVSQSTFEQVTHYNHILKAPFIVITNGLNHFCCSIDHVKGRVEYLKDLPAFQV